MADKTLLSYIPGFDEAMKSAGESVVAARPAFLDGVLGGAHPDVTNVVLLAIVLVGIGGLAFAARSKLVKTEEAVIPDESLTARTFVELILDTVLGVMSNMMGEKNAKRFFPLIATLALVILFSNLFGLLPGMGPPTDNLNMNVVMAGIVFVATHIVGIQTNGIGHITHMANPVGAWWGWFLAPLMFPIELIGHIVRPVSLSLRLMCNMIGDHQVLVVFLGLMAVPLVYPVPILVLGFIVCVVQTAVFCMLSTVYISLALEEQHHDDH